MFWATSLSPELAKVVIGVARAFGTSTFLLDQTSILDLADRFRPHLRMRLRRNDGIALATEPRR